MIQENQTRKLNLCYFKETDLYIEDKLYRRVKGANQSEFIFECEGKRYKISAKPIEVYPGVKISCTYFGQFKQKHRLQILADKSIVIERGRLRGKKQNNLAGLKFGSLEGLI